MSLLNVFTYVQPLYTILLFASPEFNTNPVSPMDDDFLIECSERYNHSLPQNEFDIV